MSPAAWLSTFENRLLYVSDIKQDQILVYDADTFKLKRKMGTGGKEHTLNHHPGDFAKPAGASRRTAKATCMLPTR